uniref:Ovule protein n=1 Tax=Panagrellus redivivus TaxID=6233 RepID=A0A7E4VD42_PANRE
MGLAVNIEDYAYHRSTHSNFHHSRLLLTVCAPSGIYLHRILILNLYNLSCMQLPLTCVFVAFCLPLTWVQKSISFHLFSGFLI